MKLYITLLLVLALTVTNVTARQTSPQGTQLNQKRQKVAKEDTTQETAAPQQQNNETAAPEQKENAAPEQQNNETAAPEQKEQAPKVKGAPEVEQNSSEEEEPEQVLLKDQAISVDQELLCLMVTGGDCLSIQVNQEEISELFIQQKKNLVDLYQDTDLSEAEIAPYFQGLRQDPITGEVWSCVYYGNALCQFYKREKKIAEKLEASIQNVNAFL